MLTAEQMRTLPDFFLDIPDQRRKQGQRHSLPCILALATAAVLCGMEGYKAIGGWADDLGQKARARFGCRKRNGRYHVPSRTTFRETLIGVDPEQLDLAPKQTKVWPSTVKPCVTLLMKKVVKRISWESSGIRLVAATLKKSRCFARRGER